MISERYSLDTFFFWQVGRTPKILLLYILGIYLLCLDGGGFKMFAMCRTLEFSCIDVDDKDTLYTTLPPTLNY